MLYPEGCEDQISLAGRSVKTILVAYFIYIIGGHFQYTLIHSDNLSYHVTQNYPQIPVRSLLCFCVVSIK